METCWDDVVVSTRVRLARNFEDLPFPGRLNDVLSSDVVRRVSEAIAASPNSKAYELRRLRDMRPIERLRMVEQHLISPALLGNEETAAVMLNAEKTVSVMIGEEDHLRIQALLPGFCLDEAASLADEVDDIVDACETYAFDDQWGYLTACPTNVGTGLRASVMLHLPALTMYGQMGNIVQAASKVGLTVRGLYGEGSEALGNLYQLSNQITLGRAEADIRLGLETAAKQVIESECRLRQVFASRESLELEDKLMRSFGAMSHARRLSSKESMQLWSDVKLASDLHLVQIDRGMLDKLLIDVQPASLSLLSDQENMTEAKRDVFRAKFVRETLIEATAAG